MAREFRTKRIMLEHIDRGEDYPIAFWDHEYDCYSMDNLPGRYVLFVNITQDDAIVAYDVYTMAWRLFRRMSDDELFRRIELAVENDIRPF